MVSGCLGPPGREEVRKSGTRAGVRMPRVPGTEAGGGGPPRRLASGISHRGRVPGPGPCTGWAGRSPLVQPGQSADRAHLTLAGGPRFWASFSFPGPSVWAPALHPPHYPSPRRPPGGLPPKGTSGEAQGASFPFIPSRCYVTPLRHPSGGVCARPGPPSRGLCRDRG